MNNSCNYGDDFGVNSSIIIATISSKDFGTKVRDKFREVTNEPQDDSYSDFLLQQARYKYMTLYVWSYNSWHMDIIMIQL